MAKIGSVKELYRRAAQDTRQVTADYWLNTSYLMGNQWLWVNPSTGRPEDRPRDNRVRLVINRMLTNHIAVMANLMQRPLEFEVRPNGADDASVEAAHVAREILYATHADHKWERVRERVYTAMKKGGTAAIALDWDDELLDTIDTPLSIAEFVVEPGALDPETARWWIKAQMLSPEVVQAMYGLSKTPDADATNGLNPHQMSILATTTGAETLNPLTVVLTYYERPNKAKPKGEFIVEVGGTVVQRGAWPFPFTDRLNLVVGVDVTIENRWWGVTPYTDARIPQVALNVAKSNVSEHLQDASVARMLVPHSAIRLMEALTDVPGNMYPYPDGLEPPKWLSPAQLPAWLQSIWREYAEDMDDLMGVHDISRGRAPANLESGSAISILAEQDGSPTARVVKSVADMFSRYSQLTLQLLEAEQDEPRSAVINTEQGSMVVQWSGSDIRGQYDAEVPHEAVLPRSRAALEQLAQEMLKMGLLTSIPEYAQFAQMPDARDIVQVMAPSVAKARRENGQMAAGRVVIPAEFDDHAAHIKEHNNFRMTVAYERLKDEEQSAVDEHVQAHETLAAEAAAKMVARMETHPALGEVPTANNDPVPTMPAPGEPGDDTAAPGSPSADDPGNVEPDPMAAVNGIIGHLQQQQ